MPRNGSGTYSLPASSWNPAVSGGTIESSAANATLSDLAAAMTQSLSKDGQTTPTGNLPMGGFKLTGLADGAAATDSMTYGQGAKLSGNNTFTGNQTINGSVSLSGSLNVSGPVIFTDSMTVENLNVSSVASVKSLNVASIASVANLNVSGAASVGSLNAVALSINAVSFPYEPGSFTPVLNFGGSATGMTYSTQNGRYTRVGNLVSFRIRIVLSAKGTAAGAMTITGLPSTILVSSDALMTPFTASFSGLTGNMVAQLSSGTTTITGQQTASTGVSAITDAIFTNTSNFTVNGIYEV